jgi:hypothetical protein
MIWGKSETMVCGWVLLASLPWGGSGSSTRGRHGWEWETVAPGSETTAPGSETTVATGLCGDYNVCFFVGGGFERFSQGNKNRLSAPRATAARHVCRHIGCV